MTERIRASGIPVVNEHQENEAVPIVIVGFENSEFEIPSSTEETGRLILSSHEQALSSNDYAGEVIRIFLKESDAKAMIAWYDEFTDPNSPEVIAWVGAHYERNGSGGAPIHQHFSIETSTGQDGNIVTRLDIPYGAETINMRITNANLNVVGGGVFAVSGAEETNRVIALQDQTIDVDGNAAYTSRWSFSVNTTAEAGTNAGSDLQINRFTDAGVFIDSVISVKRSTGFIGMGIAPESTLAKLHIGITTDVNAVRISSTHSGVSNASLVLIDGDNALDKALQTRVTSDTTSRFSVENSGKMEWGAGGSSARDSNLYREGANILATDDKLHVVLDLEVDGALDHDGSTVGFYGVTPISRALLATGAGATADNIITALQNLGLVRQS